jgi:hypothetical protein
MRKKYVSILVIGLAILFIGAAVTPIISSQTMKQDVKSKDIISTGGRWADDFSAYTLGQFLDGDATDGGWKGWDNDPTYGAFVVDTYELSVPHSVEIVADVDLVHEFSGYTSGQWTFIAWNYVPGNFVGNSYFILLSDYTDGAGQDNKWAVQMRLDADNGIVESEFDTINLPLIYDQWVEIRCEIDLDSDWLEMYYDGVLLHAKAWTAGPNNAGDGFLNIAAVDLFANAATAVYYDDISLTGDTPIPALCCQGALSWSAAEAGASLTDTFEVSNCGDPGSLLDWEVYTWPAWGSGWTFTPASGTGLTPAGSPVTVQVDFTAPSDQESEFYGNITVVNSNNPAEECVIPVYLKTPKNKGLQNTFLPRILEKYPNAFPIIRQILGL